MTDANDWKMYQHGRPHDTTPRDSHLAHRARLDREQGDGEVVGDREGRWINELHGTARDDKRSLSRPMETVRLIGGNMTGGAVDTGSSLLECPLRRRAVEDVALIRGEVLESAGISLEVLGEDLGRVAEEHLGDEIRVVFGEIALIEHEQKFYTRLSRLNGVGHACWEEPESSISTCESVTLQDLLQDNSPKIPGFEIVDIRLAVLVDSCDADTAIEDIGPFVGTMPMLQRAQESASSNHHPHQQSQSYQFAVGIW